MMAKPRHIVLLGAGHTHALALRRIAAAARRAEVRVTLVSGDSFMPYSGMLPGVIAGLYRKQEILLDIEALARQCAIDFVNENAVAIDPRLRLVQLESGAKLDYDVLSINVGGDCRGVLGEDGGDVMPVKPVLPFLAWLEGWRDLPSATVAVVGAGIAGVEIALAIDARLRRRKRVGGVYLVGRNKEIVPGMPKLATRLRRLLQKRGISQVLGLAATAAVPGQLVLEDGSEHYADHVVVCPGVRIWPRLAEAGLEVDGRGCVVVNRWLQSVSHPDVFACGDCASWYRGAIPKSGVFAVRQARTLAANLRALCTGRRLRPWRTSPRHLAIVCSGDRRAVAHRAGSVVSGRMVWLWKDYLDRKFMRKFS